MQPQTTPIGELFASLDSRYRPEDVADLVLSGFASEFGKREQVVLERAARYSSHRRARERHDGWWFGSSMSSDFARPTDASRQVATLQRLFVIDDDLADTYSDPDALGRLWNEAAESVGGWKPGDDFKRRLTRAGRKLHGVELSKRQYNRRVRFLLRLAAKIARLDLELRKRRLLLVGRSGLVADITRERFEADPAAACFVAYFVARRNMRRQFSLSGKDNPYDEVADVLFQRLGPGSDWWMVSRVYPTPDVVSRLSSREQGEMVGRWSALMRGAAEILRSAWNPATNRETMIVARGMDSSTWNTIAAAYNTARAGWINALAAVGALELLDVACPGKVMRLMAADLAYWHRSTGSDVDPDTKVWATLPMPWEVLSGTATCTRETVEAACRTVGLDPATKGWTAPRRTGSVAVFAPTPELVHGVAVADPVWAGLLRRAGVFSGKGLREPVAVPADVVVSDLPTFGA